MPSVCAVLLIAVVGQGCGDEAESDERPYVTQWEAPSRYPNAPKFSRSRRSLAIEVSDGTCYPSRGNLRKRVKERLHRVRVRETDQAVFVRVIMRPERGDPDAVCAGVGSSFLRQVPLRHPIGRRAVIDASLIDSDQMPMVYPALDPAVQHRLQRRYAGPAALDECRDIPPGVLGEKYEVRPPTRPQLARKVAEAQPHAAYRVAKRSCLEGFKQRDNGKAQE